jgi:CheY-like chemotaxis protein
LGLEPVTVLLVEDSERFRRYISSMLRKNTRLQVIAEVSDGLEAVQRAGELKPDLILLDLTLPKINGLEIARQVRHLSPASRVLFVTSRPETYTNHL